MWRQQGPHLREGDGEVEALPEAAEGDEGLGREAPGGHLAVRPLELAGRAHAVEAANEQVHAGAPVLAHAVGAAARPRVHLTVLPCRMRAEMRAGDTAGRGRSEPAHGAPRNMATKSTAPRDMAARAKVQDAGVSSGAQRSGCTCTCVVVIGTTAPSSWCTI